MSMIDDLNRINNIKHEIRTAIADKGVEIGYNTPFADYPNCIRNISGGSGGSYYEELYNKRTNNGYTLDGLFAYSRGGETLDLTGLDFSRVQTAQYMFQNCKSRINIGQCNTSNLKQAQSMFQGFTNGGAYIDLSVFDFSNVMAAQGMFSGCNLDNIDIRNVNLNFSKVRNRTGIFNNCTGTLDLSNWSIDGLTELREFFMNCMCSKINLTNWTTTNIMLMNYMFTQCSSLQELIIPNWDMTNAQNYIGMFNNCNNLRYVDIRNCNADTVSKIIGQLPNKSKANFGEIELPEGASEDIINSAMSKYWKPTSLEATPVTNGELSAVSKSLVIGEKTTLKLINCVPWYGTKDNIVFETSDPDKIIIEGNKAKAIGAGHAYIYARDNTTQATISEGPLVIYVAETDEDPGLIIFEAASEINPEYGVMQVNNQEYRGNQITYHNINEVYMLDVGAPITQIRFYQDSNISEIVKLNMSSMTYYQETFWGCTNLEYVDANNWVNENTTRVNHLFSNCTGLKEVDISNWNAENSSLSYINAFMGCTSLHTIRMDNCNNTTIRKVIINGDFPSSNKGTIYCKRANAEGLTAPGNWQFSYID